MVVEHSHTYLAAVVVGFSRRSGAAATRTKNLIMVGHNDHPGAFLRLNLFCNSVFVSVGTRERASTGVRPRQRYYAAPNFQFIHRYIHICRSMGIRCADSIYGKTVSWQSVRLKILKCVACMCSLGLLLINQWILVPILGRSNWDKLKPVRVKLVQMWWFKMRLFLRVAVGSSFFFSQSVSIMLLQ